MILGVALAAGCAATEEDIVLNFNVELFLAGVNKLRKLKRIDAKVIDKLSFGSFVFATVCCGCVISVAAASCKSEEHKGSEKNCENLFHVCMYLRLIN